MPESLGEAVLVLTTTDAGLRAGLDSAKRDTDAAVTAMQAAWNRLSNLPTGFQAGLQALQQQLATVQQQSQATASAIQQSWTTLGAGVQGMTTAVQGLTQSFAGLAAQAQQLGTQLQTVGTQAQTAQTQLTPSAAVSSGWSTFAQVVAGLGITLTIRGIIHEIENLIVGMKNLAVGAIETGVAMESLQARLGAAAGSMDAGRQAMANLTADSQRLGTNLVATANSFVQLASNLRPAGLSMEQILEVSNNLNSGFVALRTSADAQQCAIKQLGDAASLGRLQMQDFRALAQNIPSALEIMTRALGLTTEEFRTFMEKGLIPGREAVIRFAAEFARTYASVLPEATASALAAIERLNNAWVILQNEFSKAQALESSRVAMEQLATTLQDPRTVDAVRNLGRHWAEFIETLARVPGAILSVITAVKNLDGTLQALKRTNEELPRTLQGLGGILGAIGSALETIRQPTGPLVGGGPQLLPRQPPALVSAEPFAVAPPELAGETGAGAPQTSLKAQILAKAIEEVNKKYKEGLVEIRAFSTALKGTGTDYQAAAAEIRLVEGSIKKLISEGVDPADPAVKRFTDRLRELGVQKTGEKIGESLAKVMGDYRAGLAKIEAEVANVPGFQQVKAEISLTEATLGRLARVTGGETSPAFQQLTERLRELGATQADIVELTKRLTEAQRELHKESQDLAGEGVKRILEGRPEAGIKPLSDVIGLEAAGRLIGERANKTQTSSQAYKDWVTSQRLADELLVKNAVHSRELEEAVHALQEEFLNTGNLHQYEEAMALLALRTRQVNADSNRLGQSIGQTVSQLFDNLAFHTNSWSDALLNVAKSLQQMVIQLTVVEPLVNALRDAMIEAGGPAGLLQQALAGIGPGVGQGLGLGGPGTAAGGLLAGSVGAGAGLFGEAASLVDILASGFFLAFQHGGSFKVPGSGGPDSKLVQFAATPGELVTVTQPGQYAGGQVNVQVINNAPNAQIQTRQTGPGNIQIVVEEMVAQGLTKPGSAIARAMRGSYATPQRLIGR